jgi:hypothetical protein
MLCSPLLGHDDGVAVDDLGAAGQAIGMPAEGQNGDETSAAAEWHKADTARSLSYGRPVAI